MNEAPQDQSMAFPPESDAARRPWKAVLLGLAAVFVGILGALCYASLCRKSPEATPTFLPKDDVSAVHDDQPLRLGLAQDTPQDTLQDTLQTMATPPKSKMSVWLSRLAIGAAIITAMAVTAVCVHQLVFWDHPLLLDEKTVGWPEDDNLYPILSDRENGIGGDVAYHPDDHKRSPFWIVSAAVVASMVLISLGLMVGLKLGWRPFCCNLSPDKEGDGSVPGPPLGIQHVQPGHPTPMLDQSQPVAQPNQAMPQGTALQPPPPAPLYSSEDNALLIGLAAQFVDQVTRIYNERPANCGATVLMASSYTGTDLALYPIPDAQDEQTVLMASAMGTKSLNAIKIAVIKDLNEDRFVVSTPKNGKFVYVLVGFNSVFMHNPAFDNIRLDWLIKVVNGREPLYKSTMMPPPIDLDNK